MTTSSRYGTMEANKPYFYDFIAPGRNGRYKTPKSLWNHPFLQYILAERNPVFINAKGGCQFDGAPQIAKVWHVSL
jgi:hypothetical protein